MRRRGFSLLELAIVLGVSSLMLGYILQSSQSTPPSQQGCYTSTKLQMQTIREAIEKFARANNRLPLPAARNVGVESTTYGREASGASIDAASGVSFGALPFQTLKLTPYYSSDCWGNKFTYAVTTALTTSATSGGFLDSTVVGNITEKTDSSTTFSSTIAYAVISHGADELGAVKLNYSGAGHGWCSGTALRNLNCTANAAVVADGIFNDGKDAGASFFDDLVIASGKPQIPYTPLPSGTYCWGLNGYGQLGDGTTTNRLVPTVVNTALVFTKVSTGRSHTCALTAAGKPYCWGYNNYGMIGDSTMTQRLAVTAVNTAQVFSDIQANYVGTCGITTGGVAYCWGYNGQGEVGNGNWTTPITTPTAVTGGLTFSKIVKGFNLSCGITIAGPTYCWGYGTNGGLGNGANSHSNVPVLVSGGLSFVDISAAEHVCALTNTGAAYCWGLNVQYEVGDNTTTARNVPTAVLGGLTFTQITTGERHTCALTSAGDVYCWGNIGTIGGHTPTLLAGGLKFSSIFAGDKQECGLTAAGQLYCWGGNSYGELGNNTTTNSDVPVYVANFGSIMNAGRNGYASCAIQP